MYDTRHVVYKSKNMTAKEIEDGYNWAYKEFYKWSNIFKASGNHDINKNKLKHFFYTAGWKKFEPFWNFVIKTKHLNNMTPVLESILNNVRR